jgi:hypothetical protein
MCTVKVYDILKVKNALVKSVLHHRVHHLQSRYYSEVAIIKHKMTIFFSVYMRSDIMPTKCLFVFDTIHFS